MRDLQKVDILALKNYLGWSIDGLVGQLIAQYEPYEHQTPQLNG